MSPTRDEVMAEALRVAQHKAVTTGEEAVVMACQGDPRCALEDEEARAAQRAGCPWCERIVFAPDGARTDIKPGLA